MGDGVGCRAEAGTETGASAEAGAAAGSGVRFGVEARIGAGAGGIDGHGRGRVRSDPCSSPDLRLSAVGLPH